MTGLSPDVLFQTPGFNSSSTPVEPVTTNEEILEQHVKSQFSPSHTGVTEWPKDSPVATMYDVGNSSTQMILLNNRMKKSNHLRGQGKPSESARFRRDDHTQGEVYESPDPDRHFAHRGDSYVNRDRHMSCQSGARGLPISPLFFSNSLQARVRPPKSLRDVPGLMHPQLTVGQRNYLFTTAHVYSQAGTKALLKNGYYDLLRNQLKRVSRLSRVCFSSDEEYERYTKWIVGKHKLLYEDDQAVWRGSSRSSSTRTHSSAASSRTATSLSHLRSSRSSERSAEPKSSRSISNEQKAAVSKSSRATSSGRKSTTPNNIQNSASNGDNPAESKLVPAASSSGASAEPKRPTPKARNVQTKITKGNRGEKTKTIASKSPALSGIEEESRSAKAAESIRLPTSTDSPKNEEGDKELDKQESKEERRVHTHVVNETEEKSNLETVRDTREQNNQHKKEDIGSVNKEVFKEEESSSLSTEDDKELPSLTLQENKSLFNFKPPTDKESAMEDQRAVDQNMKESTEQEAAPEIMSFTAESIPEETVEPRASPRVSFEDDNSNLIKSIGTGASSENETAKATVRDSKAFDDRPPPTPLDELEY